MKKLYFLLALVLFCSTLFGQATVTIYAGGGLPHTDSITGYAQSGFPSTARFKDTISASSTTRGYGVFDLSLIPTGVTITSCKIGFNVLVNPLLGAISWTTYGYPADLSLVTDPATLYADCAAGTSISTATYGAAVGNQVLPSTAPMVSYMQTHRGTKVSVCFNSVAFLGAYTIRGESGTMDTVGDHAPYLQVSYCNLGVIRGLKSICPGGTTTYVIDDSLGSWTSSNASVATIGLFTGVLTAGVAGTTVITYTDGACVAHDTITVAALHPIVGATNVCVSQFTTLTNPVTGGTWSSTVTAVATIDATTGVLYGSGSGITNISYTTSPGCAVGESFTVNILPAPITGSTSLCVGSNDTLADIVVGGTWSSSVTSVATIGTSSGILHGVGPGSTVITYTNGTGCTATTTVNVITTPPAITGTARVCVGSTTLLSNPLTGGTWTSGGTGVATVNSGGTVTGVSGGTATITYGAGGTCIATQVVTVSSVPAILPARPTVCVGGSVLLTDPAGGGTWSTTTGTIASVDGSGNVTGLSVGTAYIYYTVSSIGCAAIDTVTVNLGASPISPSGAVTLCSGSTLSMTDATAGGAWSSSNTTVATISSDGTLTGVGLGTATITYTVGSCYVIQSVTVSTGPAPISPASGGVCIGATTTFTETASGGVWSSGSPTVATVSGGIVTGVGTGTAIISYSIGTCSATVIVSVATPPAAISPSAVVNVCLGSTTALADATPGGVWSSGATGLATVSSTGVVTGVAVGSPLISYTVGGCSVTKVVNVTTGPGVITPTPASVCIGNTTALSDPTSGGVWSSGNPFIATVNSSGVVSGVALGTVNISYSLGACIVVDPVTVANPPAAITVGGPTTFCSGSTTTLTETTTGGVWSSGAPGVATVVGGIVTGLSAGTATISYSVGSCAATVTVTVTPGPSPISPASSVICSGTPATLTETVPGGVWTSSDAGIATVSSTGLVTGIAAGAATITYTLGTCFTTATVTINMSASVGPLSGPTSECVGSSAILLTNPTPGGTWTSSNTSIATVSGGTVGGVSAGTAIITYSLVTSCGTSRATAMVTINTSPSGGIIVGPSLICAGTFTTLTDVVAGGTWHSSNATASITSGGLLTGITPGTDTITYTVVSTCGTASAPPKIITIGPYLTAGFISGPTNVCVAAHITLTDPAPGGVWSSFNAGIAGVTSGGVVTGASAGVDTIFYTVTSSCGSAVARYTITVNPLTPDAGIITGATVVCTGGSTTLTESVPGGVWSRSNTHANVTSGGVVSGVSVGIDTIRYTVTGACGTGVATQVMTISTSPTAGTITGPTSVCVGASVILSDAVTGGVWTASNANATVGSSTGLVTGVTAGTDVITYTVTNTCGTARATTTINVNPTGSAGAITGPDSVCVGSTIVLTGAIGGGSWTAGNANATVTGGGVVTGVTAGTTPITYTVTTSCGTAISVHIVTITGLPSVGVISGISNVCVGSGITWTVSTPGGIWSASNTHASVVPPGIVDGISIGVDTIFYQIAGVCGVASTYKVVNVNPVPVVTPIIGPTAHCLGTLITLTNATPDGVWTSSNPAVATIGLTTGVSMGVSLGVATISYTVTNIYGCPTSVTIQDTVVVAPVVPAITGSARVCFGGSVTLSDAATGGVWTSSNTSIASIDAASGVVTGISVGSATITYTVVNVCGTAYVTRLQTVDPLPSVAAITGTAVECVGTTTTLHNTTTGGVWSSGDTTIATVNPATGVVTGVAAGTVVIFYTYTNALGCSNSVFIANTVNALPLVAPITGTLRHCVGDNTPLVDATPGGVWSSSNPAVATVDVTGVVTGVSAGTTTISYGVTVGCTGYATAVDTVVAPPAASPITGVMHACVGASTTLSNAVPYGTWSSANTTIATADPATGVITGVAAGTDMIYYLVSNGCGAGVTDTAIVTINPIPSAGVITASFTTLCSGTTVALGESVTGGVWSSDDTAVLTVTGTSGIATAVAAGTTNVRYTVTSSFGCTNSATLSITVNGASLAATLVPAGIASLCHGHPVSMYASAGGGGITYQWLKNSTYIPGATDSFYTASTAGIYSVILSNGICSRTLSSVNVVSQTPPVISFTSPDILYTGSYYAYQWFKNGVAIVGATNSIFHETGVGIYTVEVWDAAGCFDVSSGYTVNGGGGTPSNVQQVVNGGDIKVYPNPASAIVQIEAPEKVNVSLVSMDGKVLIEQKNATSIDVSGLSDGLYMIMIYDEHQLLLKTTKFAKIR